MGHAFDLDVFPGAGASISMVEFPVIAFCRTATVQVPTSTAALDDAKWIDAKWIDADAGGPPVQLFGPYENADTDTKEGHYACATQYAYPTRSSNIPMVLGVTYHALQLYDELVITMI
jgi:hypothetical protein